VTLLLAVDGGQTGLRMSIVRDGRPGETAEVGGFAPGTGDESLAIAAAVDEARATLDAAGPVDRICLGLTGAPGDLERQRRLVALLSERLGGAQVALGGDMVTAHAGALAGQAGVVVAAGTGTVVLGVAGDGAAHRADGLGYLLGDDASGFAIAQAAVRAALRALEDRGPQTTLTAAAAAYFGDLEDLPYRLRTSASPVAAIAGFAPDVAAAARAGDGVASTIWAEAATRLVDTTASVVRRTFPHAEPGSVALSHTGRLLRARDLLLEPFLAELAARCPAACHRAPAGDALDGAARLAAHGLGRHAGLMHATEGWTG
jgi:N-acetylglucosamine kinase-like BadF-type ATPase